MSFLKTINKVRPFVTIKEDKTEEDAILKWIDEFKLGQHVQNFKTNMTANGFWCEGHNVGSNKSIDGVCIGHKPVLEKIGFVTSELPYLTTDDVDDIKQDIVDIKQEVLTRGMI